MSELTMIDQMNELVLAASKRARIEEQNRILEVISKWISDFEGLQVSKDLANLVEVMIRELQEPK